METNNWKIDATHSQVGFSVRHMVIAKVRGRFTKWNGTLVLNEADLTKSEVRVEIDAASIDTDVADRDNHLRSADFFDVERFPKLTFESSRIEAAGKDSFRVYGDLTIHGVTKEVVLDAEYGGRGKDPWGNERVAFTATTGIDRKDFGLAWNQALETGGLLVGERVTIELEVQAVSQANTKAA